jgi:membrane-associated phospholipid phosphatase
VFTSAKGFVFFIITGFFLMVLLPLSLIWGLVKLKVVSSFEINERRERSLPLFITGVSYYFTYTLFKSLMLPDLFQLLILGSTLLILVCMIITFFWKISIHTLSVGGIVGFFMALGFRYQIVFIQVVIPLILIAGVVGYARLKLEAHSQSQVYLGFVTGFLTMFLIFVLL